MSKNRKEASATVVLAVVLLLRHCRYRSILWDAGMQQIRQDADEYEALMQSVKSTAAIPDGGIV